MASRALSGSSAPGGALIQRRFKCRVRNLLVLSVAKNCKFFAQRGDLLWYVTDHKANNMKINN